MGAGNKKDAGLQKFSAKPSRSHANNNHTINNRPRYLDGVDVWSVEVKILIICPSVRPDRFQEFYKSLRETTDADLFVKSRPGSITKYINEAPRNYDYFHITNDDAIYRTPGWDKIFAEKIDSMNGWGICFGNDQLSGGNICALPFIGRNLMDLTGWLQLPTLEHLCGDCVWHYIGQKINRLFYFPNVIIEHRHALAGKTEWDDVYRRTNSREMYQKDNTEYRRWMKEDALVLIDRIKQAMEGRLYVNKS